MTGEQAEAVVDLAAIAGNVERIAGATSAAVMAVVKADGFGHGAVPVARAALSGGATWLGVTSATEALELRTAGLTAPVLSWLHSPATDFAALLAADVDVSVAAPELLDAVAAAARATGRTARVHLKIDTGMSRHGATADGWPELVAWSRKYEREGVLRVRGVWSHLATADSSPYGVTAQTAAFTEAVAYARDAGLDPELLHLANSAAVFTAPRTHFDLVRAGIAVYGVEPVPGRAIGLRPALTLRTQVIMVKRVPAGTGVSYQHTHVTSRPTTLALIPLGFADGIPRGVDGRAQVLLGGRRLPIIGRVAMDQCVVDAGDLDVHLGDPVTVLGPGDDGEPTAADWAAWAATNPHEILTGIGTRVPRRHEGKGTVASDAGARGALPLLHHGRKRR
ncbi:alanine racemase [Catellatospora methionotrophica]|uniref:Alanine racemase n=1 Tax=Catellatospora methionotrophica TaxID=121620 RepID=A0A8J3LHC5_9ACTN|nr:alanine racemase [Catellatospora methionotrophica]GIG18944.1 alanine racemase [Catellatospora methionotrophica]